MEDSNEKLNNLNLEEREEGITKEDLALQVQDFGAMQNNSNVNRRIFTNITDQKKIFNLENTCDYKLNECKGELLRIKEVLIKVIEKPLSEPEIDETTGEILKDKEIKKVCILIDDRGKSYVTGSKMFTNQMIQYIEMFGLESIENGLEIKITERAVKNSSNKALAFELI